ncbi:conserved hypothetical protein [Coccidioides posadasii str. Silveira]|uniref:Uncharacterized protein n=1 Tax=Coccidioides posadasii (strain RMSCC 757 / Silveira) TaxID=443226 RepID=E9D873_COCPS|nr:conserved hypothetical protein [Coccidioides posadasii str. Silveira]
MLIKFILEKKKQSHQSDYKVKFCTNSFNKSQQTDKKNKNQIKTRAIKLMQDPDQILERQSVNSIKKASRHKQAALLNSDTTVDSIFYKLISQLNWNQLEILIEVIKMLNRAEAD